MDTPTDTGTDAALLQLMWLASPALPVGGFSYSEGLEAAVEAQLVRDEATAGDWLVEQLHASLARADLAVVARAVEAARAGDGSRLGALDRWVRTTRETSELLQQTEQMGRSLAEWRRSLAGGVPASPRPTQREPQSDDRPHASMAPHASADPRRSAVSVKPNPDAARPTRDATRPAPCDAPHRTFPVAFAIAAAPGPATVRQVAIAYAFSWSENMMQAAIKAVPLGQSAGQRILARLAQAIPAAVDHALALPDDGRQSFTPLLAILSAQHETQYSRLFRS